MRLIRRIGLGLTALTLGGFLGLGTVTPAHAATHAGTPPVLRGTWHTVYHRYAHPTARHYYWRVRYTTKVAGQSRVNRLDYTRQKQFTVSHQTSGIVRQVHYAPLVDNGVFLYGKNARDKTEYQVADFSQHNHKMILLHSTSVTFTPYHSYGTFYRDK